MHALLCSVQPWLHGWGFISRGRPTSLVRTSCRARARDAARPGSAKDYLLADALDEQWRIWKRHSRADRAGRAELSPQGPCVFVEGQGRRRKIRLSQAGTCVGTLHELMQMEAQPLSSRYRHLKAGGGAAEHPCCPGGAGSCMHGWAQHGQPRSGGCTPQAGVGMANWRARQSGSTPKPLSTGAEVHAAPGSHLRPAAHCQAGSPLDKHAV